MQKSVFNYKGILFVIVSTIFVILLIFFAVKVLNYRLTKINVETNFIYADKQAFDKKLGEKIGAKFWLLDLKSLKDELAEDIWLDKIDLRRSLSGILYVSASEKKLFARWNKDYLLDTNFNILPDHPKAPLNLFKFFVNEEDLVNTGTLAQRFLVMFQSFGIVLNKASVSESGLWDLVIQDTILVKLGKKDLDLKLNKLFFVWRANLFKETDKIISLDLRYPNGLAIERQEN